MRFFKEPHIDFQGKRTFAFLVSGTLILIGLVSLILHNGPNYSIDFQGGTLLQIQFDKPVTVGQIREALTKIGLGRSEIQEFGSGGEFLIRAEETERGMETREDIQQTLKDAFPDNPFQVLRSEKVGPKIGSELRGNALLAFLGAIILISIYISLRFEKESLVGIITLIILLFIILALSFWPFVRNTIGIGYLIVVSIILVVFFSIRFNLRYSLAAITALFHDVLITLGIFSLLNLEISLAIVAAFLTIVGYSLNDTIVVFDRIRENVKAMRKDPYEIIINASINQSLSRTIITSLTTLMVVVILFLFGGEVIHNFALALLIGVVVGTYSSIFVASPILVEWQRRAEAKGRRP